jgi:hypothetical protein
MGSSGLDKFNRAIEKSLLLLEIPLIKFLVICLLVIYNTVIIPKFNNVVSQWFRWFWFKLFYILIIIYVAFKDKTIALLLAISFVLSIQVLEKGNVYTKHPKPTKPAKKVTFNNDIQYHNLSSNQQHHPPQQQQNEIKTWNHQISAQGGGGGGVEGINIK